MQPGDIYLLFTDPIEAMGLDYMVTGSVASSSYGEPRFTHDIDLILWLPALSVENLGRAFPLDEFYCPPDETLHAEAARDQGGHFNLVHHETGFNADVYLATEDDLTTWAASHRRLIEILPGRSIFLAPPEYVILRKLQYHSEVAGERHIRDIRSMLQVCAEEIELGFLDGWVTKLGVESSWQLVEQP